MMGEFHCFYHNNTNASKKCYKCGKYVCLECAQSISGKNASQDLCPECYYSMTMKRYSVGPSIPFLIFAVILVIFDIFAWSFGVFPGVWVLFMLALVISVLVYTNRVAKPREIKKAKSIKEKALAAKATDHGEKKGKQKHYPIYCHFCGGPLETGEQSCKYCGMSWRWQD